ncbi:transmembrane protein 231-like [Amphiura filiformis]|uniref:transmembrane protein 231-like n=1 Tax=Amphiura filiformis TaxID=82378 RepID=UPI003B20DBDA
MAVYEVYSTPVLQRYKAGICTKTTLFMILAFLFTVIPPFLVAYRSEGFWLKEDFYREQPSVSFKHQIMMVLDLLDSSYLTWSTYQNYNQLQQDHLRVPLVKTREEDVNRDGRPDMLHYNIEVPLQDLEQVYSAKLILIFGYKLNRFSSVRMESMAYAYHTGPVPISLFNIEGELKLQLKEPLAHKGLDTRYDVPVINSESIFAGDYQLTTIFSNYARRNVTTKLQCDYPVVQTGRGAGQPLILKGTIHFPVETIPYVPGFWQVMKFAWIQYLAVLVLFIFIMERVKNFVFANQIVTTVVERPYPLVSKNHYH